MRGMWNLYSFYTKKEIIFQSLFSKKYWWNILSMCYGKIWGEVVFCDDLSSQNISVHSYQGIWSHTKFFFLKEDDFAVFVSTYLYTIIIISVWWINITNCCYTIVVCKEVCSSNLRGRRRAGRAAGGRSWWRVLMLRLRFLAAAAVAASQAAAAAAG